MRGDVSQKPEAEFDEFAENYDAALNQGLSVSGEKKEYFAEGRVNLLKKRLAELRFTPGTILDFGCGTGAAVPFLRTIPGVTSIIGTDVSARSIEVASRSNSFHNVCFVELNRFPATAQIDLAYCNGVFHHIPPANRVEAVRFVHKALRPGGIFCLWENNPWNPGTRYVMRRVPFDRDAVPLAPPEATKLLARNGFEIISKDFAFYFPAALKFARVLEPLFIKVPFGAQYCVMGCRI